MSSEEPKGTEKPFVGFYFYADDTPRDAAEPQDDNPWAIAQPGPFRPPGGPFYSRPARSGRRGLWMAPAAIAIIGGVVLLDLTLEHQGRSPKQIVITALNGIGPARSAAAPRPLAKAEIVALKTEAPAIAASPPSASSSGDAPAQQIPLPPQPSPLDSCRHPQTPAELLVCRNPELAAQDKRLVRVYRAAIDMGAPKARLASEQKEWLNAREAAARRSPQEVRTLYASRIDDLAHWLDDEHAAGLRG